MKIKGLMLLMFASLMMATHAYAQLSFGKATLFNDGWNTEKKGDKTVFTRHFDMKDLRKAETYHLYFEGIGGRSTVRLNGKKIGSNTNSFVSFLLPINPYINWKGDNIVEVTAEGKGAPVQGLYRNVFLVTAPKTHLSQWGLSYKVENVSNGQAVLRFTSKTTWIHDDGYSISIELADDKDSVVAKTDEIKLQADADSTHLLTMNVSNVKLWSPDDPYLYHVTAMLHKGGKVVCRGKFKVGIKTLTTNGKETIVLNGKTLKLKVATLEAPYKYGGKDITASGWSKELKRLKADGYNVIRLAEPEPHLFYDIADKEGIFVIEGFNGKWSKKDKADMLRRDITQHTSVLASFNN